MRAIDPAGTRWRKSSRSLANSDCIEVGFGDEFVAARDSKNPAGPVLLLGMTGWAALLRGIRRA